MRLDHLLSKEYSGGNEAVLQVDQRTDRKRRELRESGDIPQARTPTGNRGESDKEDTRRNHGDCAKQPVSFSGFAEQRAEGSGTERGSGEQQEVPGS